LEEAPVPRFGELESAIMDAVWEAGQPLRVREILERLQPERDLAYNTVHTVTEILYRKGWLTKEKDGRAFKYGATGSREKYEAGLVGEALSFTDDRAAALVSFVEGMEPAEADELRRLLGAAREGER
jgi:predicted transcriptional regulator